MPDYVPGGFIRSETIEISDSDVPRPGAPPATKTVYLAWSNENATAEFSLLQESRGVRLGGGEPFTIGEFEGERRLLPAEAGRPDPLLTLSWNDGGYGFIVQASLTAGLDEATLIRVAESVGFE